MSIRWSDMRSFIRLALLRDVPAITVSTSTVAEFSDQQLLIAARWACNSLSQHTAQRATKIYDCDGMTNQYQLPDGIVDGVEKAALVIYRNSQEMDYLTPIRFLPTEQWPRQTPTFASNQL
jgi:hypothetical protein